MYTAETHIRVRYGETDQMGFVYYGAYASYYEVARVESLRKLGVTYRELEELGVMMPVVENHSKYLAPGRYDDLLRIVTTIRQLPSIRIRFEYDIYNNDNRLIHQGETLLVFMDKLTSRPCRPPQPLLDVLASYFK